MTKGLVIVAKDSKEVEAHLYGNVGEWGPVNSKQFSTEYKKLKSEYQLIKLRINSKGGDVFEGNAISNGITDSNVETHTIIDGVAASIAAMIFMAGHKRFMARNALLMFHQASGGVYGQANKLREAADLLETVNSNLINDIVSKTGKKKEEVEKWFAADKDTWFTAQQALDAGLIDGIIDPVTKAVLPENLQADQLDAYISTIMNELSTETESTRTQKFDTNKMKINARLVMALGITNITNLEDDDAVAVSIENKFKELSQENTGLKTKLETAENKLKEKESEQVKLLVDNAVKAGKITEAQRESYETLAGKDFTATKSVLDGMATPKNLEAHLKTSGGAANNRSEWDWDKWSKEDPEGLAKMKAQTPDVYQALYDKTFNK